MNVVELAERKGRLRAFIFFLLAGILVGGLLVGFGQPAERRNAFWIAIVTASAMNLTPMLRWLRPHSKVARLLDDETTREHRRTSTMAGFWAAVIAAMALVGMTGGPTSVTGYDVARVVATAAIVAALLCFATLELRASR